MDDTHYYEVNLLWESDTRGKLSSPVLPDKIEVATPPEFPQGTKEIWTPEHLFVAAVNSCLMTTFLVVAQAHTAGLGYLQRLKLLELT